MKFKENKTKNNKTKKIIAGVIGISLIGLLIVLALGFMGNPISRFLVDSSAKKYVANNYEQMDLQLEKSYYNLKDGSYIVEAKSKKSIDTHFEINFTATGKLVGDSYKESVLDGWNTWQRINDEYGLLVDDVINTEIPEANEEISMGIFIDTAEDMSYLEVDKIYDIRKMAETEGKLSLYMESKNLDSDTISDILLDIKEKFDQKDVPFYYIDIDLDEADKGFQAAKDSFGIMDFQYSDIYEDNLVKRVEENIQETKKLHEEVNTEKQEEIEDGEENNK